MNGTGSKGQRKIHEGDSNSFMSWASRMSTKWIRGQERIEVKESNSRRQKQQRTIGIRHDWKCTLKTYAKESETPDAC